MPTESTSRKRAEETLRKVISNEVNDTPSEAGGISSESTSAASSDKPKEFSRKKEPGEDFFDYLNRLPLEVFTAGGAGLYIYKQARQGNVQIDRISRAITFDELKNTYAAQNGPGSYLVQFATKDKSLSPGSQRYTFDGQVLSSLGDTSSGGLDGQANATQAQATSEAIKLIAESSREANKSNLELMTEITKKAIQPDKGLDIAALITGIASLIPKKDDSVLVAMMQSQREEAERRADAAEKRLEQQRQRDKDEAFQQRERDQQFFTMMKQQSDSMNAILLKQAESKADNLSQMTNLITSFMTVREKIEDSLGGGSKTPWDAVATIAERGLEVAPAIFAALKGATPQQVAALQAQNQPQQQAQQTNGIDQQWHELVARIGKFLGRDPALWHENEDERGYVTEMIEREYPALYLDLFQNQTKEIILQTFDSHPTGNAILKHEQGKAFLTAVIDEIKGIEPEATAEDQQEEAATGTVGPARRRVQKAVN